MDNKNRPAEESQSGGKEQQAAGGVQNPFENNQPASQDIDQAKEEINKEQQFKEALTERD